MRCASEIIRDRQRAIRREIDRRGISLKVIAYDSGIKYDTLISYFPGGESRHPAELPSSAVFALCGVLDDDLLNLLCPDGYAVVRKPEGVDYDELAHGCRVFLEAKDKAHHPESEAGRDIGPTEEAHLSGKVVRLRA